MQESTTDARRNRAKEYAISLSPTDDLRDHDVCGASPTTVSDEILGSFIVDNLTKHIHISIMGI